MMKWMRVAAVALIIPAFVACDDDPTDEDNHAEEVSSVRLTVGTQTVTINEGGVASGTITIPRNTPVPVAAEFLAADGDELILDSDFRLDLTTSTGVTFARTGNFAGTLTGTAAGTTAVVVGVFHSGEQHYDWGGNQASTAHRFNLMVQ